MRAGGGDNLQMPRWEICGSRSGTTGHPCYLRSLQSVLQPFPGSIGQVYGFANNCWNQLVSPMVDGVRALYLFAADRRAEIEPIAARCVHPDRKACGHDVDPCGRYPAWGENTFSIASAGPAVPDQRGASARLRFALRKVRELVWAVPTVTRTRSRSRAPRSS